MCYEMGLEYELKNGPYIGLYSGPSTGPFLLHYSPLPRFTAILVDDVVANAVDLVPIPPVLATGGAGDIRAKGLEPFGRCLGIRIQKRPTKNIHEFVSLGVRTWPCITQAEDSAKRPELKA